MGFIRNLLGIIICLVGVYLAAAGFSPSHSRFFGATRGFQSNLRHASSIASTAKSSSRFYARYPNPGSSRNRFVKQYIPPPRSHPTPPIAGPKYGPSKETSNPRVGPPPPRKGPPPISGPPFSPGRRHIRPYKLTDVASNPGVSKSSLQPLQQGNSKHGTRSSSNDKISSGPPAKSNSGPRESSSSFYVTPSSKQITNIPGNKEPEPIISIRRIPANTIPRSIPHDFIHPVKESRITNPVTSGSKIGIPNESSSSTNKGPLNKPIDSKIINVIGTPVRSPVVKPIYQDTIRPLASHMNTQPTAKNPAKTSVKKNRPEKLADHSPSVKASHLNHKSSDHEHSEISVIKATEVSSEPVGLKPNSKPPDKSILKSKGSAPRKPVQDPKIHSQSKFITEHKITSPGLLPKKDPPTFPWSKGMFGTANRPLNSMGTPVWANPRQKPVEHFFNEPIDKESPATKLGTWIGRNIENIVTAFESIRNWFSFW